MGLTNVSLDFPGNKKNEQRPKLKVRRNRLLLRLQLQNLPLYLNQIPKHQQDLDQDCMSKLKNFRSKTAELHLILQSRSSDVARVARSKNKFDAYI